MCKYNFESITQKECQVSVCMHCLWRKVTLFEEKNIQSSINVWFIALKDLNVSFLYFQSACKIIVVEWGQRDSVDGIVSFTSLLQVFCSLVQFTGRANVITFCPSSPIYIMKTPFPIKNRYIDFSVCRISRPQGLK